MNAPTISKGFGTVLYGVAAMLVVFGVVLNANGSVQLGTILIGLGVSLAGGTAIQLGHLKKW